MNSTVGTCALLSLLVRNCLEDTSATLSQTEEEDVKSRRRTSNGKWSWVLSAEAALTAQQPGRGRGDYFEEGMRSGVVAPQRDDCVGGEQ